MSDVEENTPVAAAPVAAAAVTPVPSPTPVEASVEASAPAAVEEPSPAPVVAPAPVPETVSAAAAAPAAVPATPGPAAAPAVPLTPAERAAQRRLRILAQGGNRMSLVTGAMSATSFAEVNAATPVLPATPAPAPARSVAATPVAANGAETPVSAATPASASSASAAAAAAAGAASPAVADATAPGMRNRFASPAPAQHAAPAGAAATLAPVPRGPAATPLMPASSLPRKPWTWKRAESIARFVLLLAVALVFSAPAPLVGEEKSYGVFTAVAAATPFAQARPVAAFVLLWLLIEAAVGLSAHKLREAAKAAAKPKLAPVVMPLHTPVAGTGGNQALAEADRTGDALVKLLGQADKLSDMAGGRMGVLIRYSGYAMTGYKVFTRLSEGFCFVFAATATAGAVRAYFGVV